jgi:hypothetical protein
LQDSPEGALASNSARLDELSSELKTSLDAFGYRSVDIHLSDLLLNYIGWTEPTMPGKAERTRHLQDVGDAFRGEARRRIGFGPCRYRYNSVSAKPHFRESRQGGIRSCLHIESAQAP